MLARSLAQGFILGLILFMIGTVSHPPERISAQSQPISGDAKRAIVRTLVKDARTLSTGAQAWLNADQEREEIKANLLELTPQQAFRRDGRNIDANDPDLDFAPGQVESAMAAATGVNRQERVMAGWIDASALVFENDPTDPRASFTQVALSIDGARSFRDLGGLPNPNHQQQWSGDPTIVALDQGKHFIIGSLYFPSIVPCEEGVPSEFNLALSVATVADDGSAVSFSDPIVIARGSDVCAADLLEKPFSLLDKLFLSFDPTTRTLAVSYTNFFFDFSDDTVSDLGQIELARATVPADPTTLSPDDFAKIVVWPQEPFCDVPSMPNQCGATNTGAYPAVGPDGTIYVAWERNWIENLFNGDPCVYLLAAAVPLGADTPNPGGPDSPRLISAGQQKACNSEGGIKSMDTVEIPGYSRVIGHDFPRIAFDRTKNQIVFSWNDSSLHPLGDIWLRSADSGLANFSSVFPVNRSDFTLHFMPAVSVATDGSIRTSWYGRRRPDSTLTSYFGETRPRIDRNAGDFLIANRTTDWSNTVSALSPNFGDYTDNVTDGRKTYYTWTDGRLGISQPFVSFLKR